MTNTGQEFAVRAELELLAEARQDASDDDRHLPVVKGHFARRRVASVVVALRRRRRYTMTMLHASDLHAHVVACLASPPTAGGARGDRNDIPDVPPRELIPAAVLVPLVEHTSGATVLLTRRSEVLPDHPGQISFPGGRIDPADINAEATALRETLEETGVGPEHIVLAGRLDDYETGTGYRVTPVVGLVRPGFRIRLSPVEVDEVFEVPLDFVLDTANHQLETVELRGVERTFWVLIWEGRRVWGATAGILVNLAGRLVE